jgi:hypothetical protein
MMVSKNKEPGGQELIEAVVSATGLPGNLVEDELQTIIRNTGHAPTDLTLDKLREAMIAYLESTYKDLALLEEAEQGTNESDRPIC